MTIELLLFVVMLLLMTYVLELRDQITKEKIRNIMLMKAKDDFFREIESGKSELYVMRKKK